MVSTSKRRTKLVKKNIVASFIIKGIDCLVYFLLVPLTLGYLNEYEYGIWLTLNSILMWINSFDIGLGNGLRNKLGEAMAEDNKPLAKTYVSTTFFMLCGLMTLFLIVASILMPFIDWYSILSASPATVNRLNQIVFISFSLFCVNFVLKFIGNIYLALQLPAINNFLVCLGHLLSLIVIYVLSLCTSGSLLLVAIAYSACPPLVYLLSFPITFGLKYKFLSPSIKFFKKEYLRNLFSMGVLFFIIQLGGLLLFSTANLIISHLFGPENVTPYNITYRYFSIVLIGMTLLLAPLWSASTDAYVRGDLIWIQKAMKKVKGVLIFMASVILLMILLSNIVYKTWLGNEILIPKEITIGMGIYILILICSLSYSNFLNGMGKLKIQSINTIVVGILYIPLGIIMGKILGVIGVILSLCIANMSGLILNQIQYNKVIKNKCTGIWNS